MPIKVLFFDTSALIKLFINEDGSDVIKWLTRSSTKAALSLHFVVNQQVCTEFSRKIYDFEKYQKVSKLKADDTITKFEKYYKDLVFSVIGQQIISNSKIEKKLDEIICDLSLKKGKNDWDALHYQSIVNALAYLGGESTPILVTADNSFGNKVALKGYRVINPMKHTIVDIEIMLA